MKRLFVTFGLAFLLVACGHQINVSEVETDEMEGDNISAEQMGMPVPGEEDVEEMEAFEESASVETLMSEEAVMEEEPTSRTVMLHSVNWAFEPATIMAKQGEDLSLHLMGIEGNHGISIPGLGINRTMNQGENAMVKIPTDKPGTYEFFCNVFCGEGHKEMKGTIVIE